MKRIILLNTCLLLTCSGFLFAQTTTLKTEIDSLSYAMGIYNASTMKQANVNEININAFSAGFEDGFAGKESVMTMENALEFLNNFFSKMHQRKAADNLIKGQKFLEENAKKQGVISDPSGLQYKVIKQGDGPKPTSTDVVKVHYHGTLIDGTVFDSSVERGEPVEFPLNRVIKGWTIGVTFMNVGSKFIFFIPSDLAYGPNPRQGSPIGPNELLIFEVELLGIINQ